MSIVFVPLPNTFRCEFIFTQQGQTVENVFHVESGGGVLVADADRIAGKLKGWWTSDLRGQVTGDVTLQRIEVVDASQQGGVGIIYTTGLPQVGSASSSGLPGSVTIAIKWTTGFTGKSFRGRNFHVGLRGAAVIGNQLNGIDQTNLQSHYTALIGALAAGATADALVVGSKRHNNAWRTTGVVTHISACSVDPNIDCQRRRLTGTGRGT